MRLRRPASNPAARGGVVCELPLRDVVHDYLSTACLHGEHGYCQGAARLAGGSKSPGCCTFCGAPCRCSCHADGDAAR